MGSSHFIQRLLEGRTGRQEPMSKAQAFHSESRQVLTLHNQVSPGLRATWPARGHLARACATDQSRTLQKTAMCKAFLVARLIQSTHNSSSARLGPDTLRSIAR